MVISIIISFLHLHQMPNNLAVILGAKSFNKITNSMNNQNFSLIFSLHTYKRKGARKRHFPIIVFPKFRDWSLPAELVNQCLTVNFTRTQNCRREHWFVRRVRDTLRLESHGAV